MVLFKSLINNKKAGIEVVISPPKSNSAKQMLSFKLSTLTMPQPYLMSLSDDVLMSLSYLMSLPDDVLPDVPI